MDFADKIIKAGLLTKWQFSVFLIGVVGAVQIATRLVSGGCN